MVNGSARHASRGFRRRAILGWLAGGAAAPSFAQRPVPVVGFLTSAGEESLAQFREAMAAIGHVEGSSFRVELRSARGQPDRLPALARELTALPADVIYATGPPAVAAAHGVAGPVPIVAFDLESDPVASGFVQSLAQPGGRLTGLFLDLPSLAGKWIALLNEVVPGQQPLGVLWDATTGTAQLDAARQAARGLRIETMILRYGNAAEMDETLRADAAQRIRSLVILSSPIASGGSARLAELASRRRLPTISPFRAFAERGGLLSYGPNLRLFRRYSADYVDRILRGARPAELPIQQPTTFELVVNRRAAKSLGLRIPDTVLLAAAQVLE